jgi:hypothetical protein
MIRDVELAGFAPGTKHTYLAAVIALQKQTGMRPDKLSEKQVFDYLFCRTTCATGSTRCSPLFFREGALMTDTRLELADVVHRFGPDYEERFGHVMLPLRRLRRSLLELPRLP